MLFGGEKYFKNQISSPILTDFVFNPDPAARRGWVRAFFVRPLFRSYTHVSLPSLLRIEASGLFLFEINVLEKDSTPYAMPTLTEFAYESFLIQSVSSKERR